ncbi:dihydrofolate reductase [Pedobacter sp.]|nr:dihydrofolate reductase [Candidatus Saccharibacteria bacterium]
MKSIIVAYDRNHAIGYQNKLPWAGMLPADVEHFRQMTTGKAVIMGRNTFDSLGAPLSNRLNIVLSHTKIALEDVVTVTSMEEAYSAAKRYENCFVIGGAQIFQLALQTVDTIYATEVDVAMERADEYFPSVDLSVWKTVNRQSFPADDENMFAYTYVTYERY